MSIRRMIKLGLAIAAIVGASKACNPDRALGVSGSLFTKAKSAIHSLEIVKKAQGSKLQRGVK